MCERVLAGAGGGGAGGWQRRREGRQARTARTAHRAAAPDEIGYNLVPWCLHFACLNAIVTQRVHSIDATCSIRYSTRNFILKFLLHENAY